MSGSVAVMTRAVAGSSGSPMTSADRPAGSTPSAVHQAVSSGPTRAMSGVAGRAYRTMVLLVLCGWWLARAAHGGAVPGRRHARRGLGRKPFVPLPRRPGDVSRLGAALLLLCRGWWFDRSCAEFVEHVGATAHETGLRVFAQHP